MIHEFAPAKINLFLDILDKRPDGYHDLGTLFQTIDVGDELSAEANTSGEISMRYNFPQEYPLEKDLVYKAVLLLKQELGVRAGADFYLEKKMPLGAGLGGGSADAAAAFRLLNRLWNLNLSSREMESLGAKIGADVPFLICGGSAFAEGIGDRLTPLSPLTLPAGSALLVATPLCTVPTKAAYAGCIPSGDARWKAYRKSDFADFKSGAFNKFEETVLPQFPPIARLKQEMLSLGADFALMSGSGASVFGVFPSRLQAENAAKKLAPTVRYEAVTDFFCGFLR